MFLSTGITSHPICIFENSDKTYDLLAGLINETISDRVAKGRKEYRQFLHLIGESVGDDESTTYGRILADTLKKTQGVDYHGDRIQKLKEECANAEDKHTMESLMAKGNGRYTLPTEAQWEYACRAETNTRFYTGNEADDLDKAGWYSDNSKGQTHPVREKKPNKFGLYDMHGNVWEWCLDWYGRDYYSECKKEEALESPSGPETGSNRVLRGGSWSFSGRYCRSACRSYYSPGYRLNDIGFRLVFVP